MSSIEELAAALAQARSDEANARAKRIECEEAILAQYELDESGSKTVKTSNGLKLTLKTAIAYKIDKGAELPEHLLKRTEKVELNVKAYEAMRQSDPIGFGKVAAFVTTTPRKPSVALAVI